MLTVFDRIRSALAQGAALSKAELFLTANIPNTDSNRAMFQILVKNNKLLQIGKGRSTKYYLPITLSEVKPPEEGLYTFLQRGDGTVMFKYEEEDTIVFDSYESCKEEILRRLGR